MEARSRTAEGRVFCSSRGGRFSILWTDTPTKVFASASAAGGDRNAVYGWWRDQAGPEKALGMEHEMRATGPYPDAIERELLLAHLPSNVRAGCKRTMTPDPNVFLRSVTCSGPSGGLARYSYAHSGTALRVYYLNRVTAEGVEYPTSDACRTSATAARPWRFFEATKGETTSRRADGTVLCFLRGTKAGLEWTDIGTLIYGSASARASARGALYDWWRMHSGPVASTEMATGHAMK